MHANTWLLQWLVAAFGLSATWRMVQQLLHGGGVRVQEAAFAGLAGWALYKQVRQTHTSREATQ